MSDETKQARTWFSVDVRLEPRAREAVEYALMEAGALGSEVSDETGELLRVSAYFSRAPEREEVRAALFDALRIYDLPTSSVHEMELREVADRDWLGEWKKSWQPVPVGERFLIAPPWSEIPKTEARITIRIEPGMAFGKFSIAPSLNATPISTGTFGSRASTVTYARTFPLPSLSVGP